MAADKPLDNKQPATAAKEKSFVLFIRTPSDEKYNFLLIRQIIIIDYLFNDKFKKNLKSALDSD